MTGKPLKGKLTISRVTSSAGPPYVKIEVIDEDGKYAVHLCRWVEPEGEPDG